MPRRRLHLRRKAAVGAAILFLLGLLQMNQWLPGGWPGGGGDGGFRSAEVPRGEEARVRPPLGLPPPDTGEVVTIQVRLPSGEWATDGWSLALAGGREAGADGQGRVRLPSGAGGLAAGFRLEGPGDRTLEHGPASPLAGTDWVVHLPPTPTTLPAAGARELVVRVRKAEDGAPFAGASVTWEGWGEAGRGRTSKEGSYGHATDAARLRVTVEAPGRFSIRRWVDPRRGALDVVLHATPAASIRFVDAEDGTPVVVDHLRLLDADGVEWLDEATLLDPLASQDRLDLERVPGLAEIEGAVLEVGGDEHPVVRVPLASAPEVLALSRGRAFPIRALDERGSPLPRTRVHAHYQPLFLGDGTGAPSELTAVTRTTKGTAFLPDGVAARLLVEAGASAPEVMAIPSDLEPGRQDVRLAPGGRVHVRVLSAADETPLGGADVVLVAAVDGLRLERRGVTNAEGMLRILELPLGWVEVYAHAPRSAWSVATYEVEAGVEGEVVLPLQPGRTLMLVVETPGGLPLEGVRVQADPEEGAGRPDVVPPHAAAVRTTAAGVLVLPDLLDRAYRLRFSKPGYLPQVLKGVTPDSALHFVTLLPD